MGRIRLPGERTNTSEHLHLTRDGEVEKRKKEEKGNRVGPGRPATVPKEACEVRYSPVQSGQGRVLNRAPSSPRRGRDCGFGLDPKYRTAASHDVDAPFTSKRQSPRIGTFAGSHRHEQIGDNQTKRLGDLLYQNSSRFSPYNTRRISLYWRT